MNGISDIAPPTISKTLGDFVIIGRLLNLTIPIIPNTKIATFRTNNTRTLHLSPKHY